MVFNPNRVLQRYLLKQFLTRTGLMIIALSFILLAFDFLSNIVNVTSHTQNLPETIFYYLALRFPSILSLAVPMGVLLATMMTLIKLVHDQEMTMFFASGMTLYYVSRILLKGALLVAAFHFLVANVLVPVTAPHLSSWAKNNYEGPPPGIGSTSIPGEWMVAGTYILNAGQISPDRKTLEDVTIIHRNQSGLMTQFYKAEQARFEEGIWQLYDVTRKDLSGTEDILPKLSIDLQVKPKNLAISSNLSDLGISTLSRLARNQETTHSNYLYSLWTQRRLAEPLASLIMVLIAMPLGFPKGRQNNILGTSFGVVAGGFVFFIIERLLFSIGETGTIPTFLAVWSPALLFSILGFWLLLYKQD